MQIRLPLFLFLIFLFSCNSNKIESEKVNLTHPKHLELNAQYGDAQSSPLIEDDRKKFSSLNFFPENEDFKIMASYTLTPEEKPFAMPTSTDRRPIYRKYLQLNFEINGVKEELAAYRDQSVLNHPIQSRLLFIPFLDKTNGIESYGGGRYLDIEIPQGNSDSILIDFNACYNPYCAYNYKYSCPRPPLENVLDLRVEAGVKTGMTYR